MTQSRPHPSSAFQPFPLWKPLSPALVVPLLSQCPPALLHHPQAHGQILLLKAWPFCRRSPSLHRGAVVPEDLQGTLQQTGAQILFLKSGEPEHHLMEQGSCPGTWECPAVTPKTPPQSSEVGDGLPPPRSFLPLLTPQPVVPRFLCQMFQS